MIKRDKTQKREAWKAIFTSEFLLPVISASTLSNIVENYILNHHLAFGEFSRQAFSLFIAYVPVVLALWFCRRFAWYKKSIENGRATLFWTFVLLALLFASTLQDSLYWLNHK